ncbi:1-alkyl-2-acetylglycerophosphocholine esterase [Apodemus speciosus]|uniref:1-alkyl-2-acetylglycerophosphocholine esterase n=1 Tax=Apodemus speciosus TaxID=105296 RepID=A0ABQ0FPA8_APOSI
MRIRLLPRLQPLLSNTGYLAKPLLLSHRLPQFDQVDTGDPAQCIRKIMFHKLQSVMSAANPGHSKIPKGNGSYPVGCTDLMFGFGNESIFLRLYYPAQDQGPLDTVWIPNKEYFLGLSVFLGTPSIVGNILHLLYETIYSAIGIDLASNGFIVATVEHRDRSASATYYFEDQAAAKEENRSWFYLKKIKQEESERVRKEQVRQRAKECSQALSAILDLEHGKPKENVLGSAFDVKQLKDAIDEDKIAVIGHSFGGATVIQALK